MIPRRLKLSNFLSYRETTVLDFEGIHLACISGLNGAGKSSLLDAMTWALFGKSRSRSDDDVVNRLAARDGQAAEVRFVFDLEGTEYRVLRQKQQGRTSVLEFQLCAGDGEWRTLSEGGVRQTQAAIESLLRMNFDTFTNASFFLQGQADEFTTKTPGQRKEILADLLGVNRWDRYKEEAARRRKEEEEKLLVLDARLQEIDAELDQQEAREAELARAKTELEQIGERLAEKEKLQEQMRRVVAAVQQQQQQVQNLRQALTRAEARLQRLREKEAQRRRERAQYQALLDDATAIQAAHAAWREAQETLNAWQKKADVYNRLQRERRPHELALERARTALEEQIKELQKQGRAVEEMRQERAQAEQTLEESREQVQQLEAEREALAQREEAWHEARSALQRLQDRRQMQQGELEKLKAEARRMERLQQERAGLG
jgi:exonuclease SbcC